MSIISSYDRHVLKIPGARRELRVARYEVRGVDCEVRGSVYRMPVVDFGIWIEKMDEHIFNRLKRLNR